MGGPGHRRGAATTARNEVQGAHGVTGRLYVVSTPIGNLGDLSYRAVEVLGSVAAILAEDTRRTRHLLEHYGVKTRMIAYHEHNEAQMVPRALSRLSRGQDLALVSDAGTPLLSDPGSRLVSAARESGVPVVPVPGASALLAAMVGAGLPTDRFTFFGFPARKGRVRDELLRAAAATAHTAILYEAANRVADTLTALAEFGAGVREAVVARELTKKFEEFRRGSVATLAAAYRDEPPRGEVVILLAPLELQRADPEVLADLARQLRTEGLPGREIARRLTEEHGAPRNLAYKLSVRGPV